MKYIFILEAKKAVNNRKNWFVVVLYTAVLILFAVSNMETFEEVRQKEITKIEYTVRQANNAASVMDAYLTSKRHAGYWADNPIVYRAVVGEAASARRFVQNYLALKEAMLKNDRQREFEIFNKTAQELYLDINAANEVFMEYPQPMFEYFPLNGIHYYEWKEFNRVRAEYIQLFEDNSMQYIYKNEMTGFNFIYQAMLQLMPYIILLIAFISICDVFTSDNEAGSYKFLLLQPLSRLKIYAAKLVSALTITFVQIFVPLIIVFVIMGVTNGFGSPNYPVLFHAEAYASFTPAPNCLSMNLKKGFNATGSPYFNPEMNFTNDGYAYVVENASIGISVYSPWVVEHISPLYQYYYQTAFVPSPSLGYMGMLMCILATLPIYIALLLLASSLSALLGIVSQNSVVTLACGAVVSAAAATFIDPIRELSLIQRLNPFLYTNPVNILNGLGSTTALTGLIVLSGISVIVIVVGAAIFSKRDIKC